jgi:calnexin
LGDEGLVVKSKAAQHAISAPFAEVVKTDGKKPLVVQYEAKFQTGLSCGGAYLKLLSESPDGIQAKEFSDQTPYTIMFGPDKCGQTNKVHFIVRHQNPVTGTIEEKHLIDTPYPKLAKTTNLYTLVVQPDNSYEIFINHDSRKKGTLFEHFQPPFNPPKEIDDPEDFKPADWVDEERIPSTVASKPADWDEDAPAEISDPDATKPDGWLEDEPLRIRDPEAQKPEEWDDEEDGEWAPPLVPNPKCQEAVGCGPWSPPTIPNPKYRGKWSAPMVPNPDYKGVWAPRKIANPEYYNDEQPSNFTPMAGIGFEIWTMDEDILFDNIYVGYSPEDAKKLAEETFDEKLPIEQNLEKKTDDEQKAKDAEEAKEKGLDAAKSIVEKYTEEAKQFLDAAREDPIEAFKAFPQIAGGLGAAVTLLLGLVAILAGLAGSKAAPAVKDAAAKGKKKIDAPTSSSSAKGVTSKTSASETAKAKSTSVTAAGSNGTSKRTVVSAEDDED